MFKAKIHQKTQNMNQFFVKKNKIIRQKLSDLAAQISHKLSYNQGNLILDTNDQNIEDIRINQKIESEIALEKVQNSEKDNLSEEYSKSQKQDKDQQINTKNKINMDLRTSQIEINPEVLEANLSENSKNRREDNFVNILQEEKLDKNPTLHIISEENKELIAHTLEELKLVTEEKTSEIKENLTKIINQKMAVANQKLHELVIKMTQNIKKLSQNTVELKEKFEKSEIHSFDYSNFVTEKNFILVNKTIQNWVFPISVWVRTVGILTTLVITFLSWSESRNQINLGGLLAIFLFTISLTIVLSRKYLDIWKMRFEEKGFKVRFLTTFGILFLLSLQFWPVVGSVLFTFAFQSSFLVFTTTILASILTIFGHYFLLNNIKKEILGNLLLVGGFLSWYAIFRFSFGVNFPDFVNIIYIFIIANTFSQINAIDLLKLNLQTIGLALAVYTTTTKFPSGVELMVLSFICALGVMIRVALDFWQILIKTFRKNEELLHNTLPPSIAKRLQNETLIADSFESASVLFCDIVGYTNYSSGKNPEEVVKTLNFIFSQFDELCEKLGLEKIKTIGDAYMVAGGLMGNWDNHAYKTAQMGLGIRQIMSNLNREFGLNMRIGIHSGKVVAGVIGLKKFTYDIWGDTVNVASRMESHSLPGQIQISKATWELIKNDFEFSKPNTVAVKGKGEMITYFLVDQKIQLDQSKDNVISVDNVENENQNPNFKNIANQNSNQNIEKTKEIDQVWQKNNLKTNLKIDNLAYLGINSQANSQTTEKEVDFDVDWNQVLEENYKKTNQIKIIKKTKNKLTSETIDFNQNNKVNYQINSIKKQVKQSQIIKIIPNKKIQNITKLATN